MLSSIICGIFEPDDFECGKFEYGSFECGNFQCSKFKCGILGVVLNVLISSLKVREFSKQINSKQYPNDKSEKTFCYFIIW